MHTFEEMVDEKLAEDADFQSGLDGLSDDEKAERIEARKGEVIRSEAPTWFENATKHEKAYNDTKTRAENAERELKKLKPSTEVKKVDDTGMSTKDFFALSKANVPEEDIDEVLDYAKFKGISVSEALSSSVVRSTLAEKAETRRTSQATNTRQTRTQQTAADGESIIASVKGGKGEDALPEAGSKEAEALFWARRPGAKRS